MPQSNFQTEFDRLNPAQREAVETIEGPLLVIAGPGTGKTQTLALRLANILKKTQARPHHLLALTFTESAALELKRRLAKIIGPDAYGITATTFHAFCQRLHGLFPDEFAATRERVVLDSLGQLKLISNILEHGEYPTLRPATNPVGYLYAIGKAIQTLKKEGYDPTRFAELIANEKIELAKAERINPRTGKPFGKIVEAERRLAKNTELIKVYETYQKLLTERELTDFDDLILTVVARLNDPKSDFLLAYLQENFLYATADEFQDTNGAQDAILRAWASYDAAPNLCVVGDDDQSIYRFQGASLANITDFVSRYPTAKVVTLTENYRSIQPILDTSRNLIERNKQRLTEKIPNLSKTLTAANTAKKTVLPQVWEFGSEEDETATIVREIQKLLAAKVPATEIAVLYRTRRHGDIVADYLTRAGVSFHRVDGENALQNRRIRQLEALLTAIVNPADSESTLKVLFADYAGLTPTDSYRLARAANRDQSILDFLVDEKNLERLNTEFEKDLQIKLTDPTAVRELAVKFLSWQMKLQETSLTEFIETVIAESGLAGRIIAEKEYSSAEAIAAFTGSVRNFELANETPRLTDFLADLKMRRQHNLSLPLPVRPQAAVQLLTVHAAKGLEFRHVFVIHLTDDDWGGRKHSELLRLPNLIPTASEDDRIEDERRLLFVALTRAREGLILSTARTYDGRERGESRFLAEIDPHLVKRQQLTIDPANKIAFVVPTTLRPDFDTDSQQFLTSLVDRFRLSPTALNTYLACPFKFLFQSLLRVPTGADPSERSGAIFGSAAHAALEKFGLAFQKTGHLPQIELAITALTERLHREPLTKKQFADFHRDAGQAIRDYLDHHSADWQSPADIEFNFGRHDIHLPSTDKSATDIPLTGKVDRIDFAPGSEKEVILIDYKTSPVVTRNAILGQTASSTGDLYRQLVFYRLLAELDTRFIYQVRAVTLSFVRPDHSGQFHDETFEPTLAEIEDLKNLISETFKKIRALEFDCTTEITHCRKCSLKEMCGKK